MSIDWRNQSINTFLLPILFASTINSVSVEYVYGGFMIKTVKRISNDLVIIYSSTFDRYYLTNLETQYNSAEGYKNEDDALAAFKNDKVIWVAGIKK